jgi:hypothetical protein
VHGSLQHSKGQADSCRDLPQQLLCDILSVCGRNSVAVVEYAKVKWNIFAIEFYKCPDI